MHFRLSRLRFLLIRSVFCLLFFILILEIRTFFRNDMSLLSNPMEILEIDNEDQLFGKEQIEFFEKQRRKKNFNWTKVFYDLYERKIEKLNQRDRKNLYKIRSTIKSQTIPQNIIEIIEETPVFQRPKFCSSTHIFHSECPYTNCKWSCKKSSTNEKNIRRASIFHHVDINKEEMHEKLKSRSAKDIWILWIDEANRQLEHLNEYQFNWTISFRQDSEISIGTYGLLIPDDSNSHSINKSDLILPSDFLHILTNHNILITDSLLENQIFTNYRFRSKHALWFVSNCDPKDRLRYYHQLKSYFPIHAFGSCVNNPSAPCNKNAPCEIDQSRFALFYLAFESQTCQDYITEKFWRALYHGMIPVVFGPDKQSYLDLGVPESAFIHTDDFQSAKDLAKYLHRIAHDYLLYRQYFQWLDRAEIFYQPEDLEAIRMCELCMRLNSQEEHEWRFYRNIHQWHRAGC